jgi:hypothetical protein
LREVLLAGWRVQDQGADARDLPGGVGRGCASELEKARSPLANSGRKFRPELPIIAAEKVYAAGISHGLKLTHQTERFVCALLRSCGSMSELSPDEPSIATAGADPDRRKAAAHEAHGVQTFAMTSALAATPIARRDGRRTRLTADASIRGRNSNACGAEAAPLGWRPTCGDDAPPPFVSRSPAGDGALSIAVQPAPKSFGHRLSARHAFVPPTIPQDSPEAPILQPTEGWQDKSRSLRARLEAERTIEYQRFVAMCALSRDVRIRETGTKSAPIAHCAQCHPHDRKASRPRVLLGRSHWLRGGSQWSQGENDVQSGMSDAVIASDRTPKVAA